jgi:diguanylate cyclase (GGDEF)-like protein
MDRITQAIKLARRKKTMVAVITIDLDDFKVINDTYGHAEGDRLLVEIASRMTDSIRESDTIARMGGDEFLMLSFPEVSSVEGIEIALKRLQKNVRQPFDIKGNTVRSTLSIGIAVYPKDGKSAEELILKSDEALYIAKKQGKNCYMFAE